MTQKQKKAVVTGSTKGIGRAIAESLAKDGYKVCITGRSEKEVKEVVADLKAQSLDVVGYPCDVKSYDQVKSLVKEFSSDGQNIDLLVNNAGIGHFGTITELSVEKFEDVIQTNLVGVFYLCKEVVPIMKKHGGGYIINISSLAGTNAHPKMTAYNASKFGLNGFSEALMQEVRQDGIKVSYLMPGSVNTYFGGDTPSLEKSWQLQPEDIAETVMDLLKFNPRALPSRVELRPSRPPVRG